MRINLDGTAYFAFCVTRMSNTRQKINLCFSLRQLALSGGDLIAQGIPQGPEIGEILNDLLQRVIAGELSNEKTTLLEEAVAFAQRNVCKKK